MNKILHYVLIVFVTMISNQLLAQQTTVEFNAGTDLGKYDGKKIKGGFNNGSDEISKDGITISVQMEPLQLMIARGIPIVFIRVQLKLLLQ